MKYSRLISKSAALLMLLLCIFPVTQASPAREDTMQAIERMKQATEENQEKIKQAIAEFRAGKISEQEYIAGAAERQWPDYASISKQVISVYRENPKDDDAVTAMAYVLYYLPADYSSGEHDEENLSWRLEIAELFLKYHAHRPDGWETIRYLGLPGATQAEYFKRLYEKSNNPHTRLQTGLWRAQYFTRLSTDLGSSAQQQKANRKQANQLLESLKAEAGEHLPEYSTQINNIRAQLEGVIGQPLADFEVADLNGNPDRLSNHTGKVLLIDIWATWCSPCKEAIPDLRAIQEELAARPFEMISASVDDEAETVLEYIQEEQPMPWIHWHLGPEQTQISGITGYPTYLVVDHKGILKAKITGSGSEHRIREELLRLIKLAEK
ncbi:TlpA disulfide reductase family protein [Porticoccus sp. W117]|uniref:TlpA family protein disulfide reductase n=1 Tax=Porticoccus sp. W117 TaxID=3054777 RepID=UPI0025939055|nr:TlpA disulfide reductase family protein [Porticoccus sp. W117]MDM3870841.1 TlpA disulfide reductase family protein [Porticoccus sp. W117]